MDTASVMNEGAGLSGQEQGVCVFSPKDTCSGHATHTWPGATSPGILIIPKMTKEDPAFKELSAAGQRGITKTRFTTEGPP